MKEGERNLLTGMSGPSCTPDAIKSIPKWKGTIRVDVSMEDELAHRQATLPGFGEDGTAYPSPDVKRLLSISRRTFPLPHTKLLKHEEMTL